MDKHRSFIQWHRLGYYTKTIHKHRERHQVTFLQLLMLSPWLYQNPLGTVIIGTIEGAIGEICGNGILCNHHYIIMYQTAHVPPDTTWSHVHSYIALTCETVESSVYATAQQVNTNMMFYTCIIARAVLGSIYIKLLCCPYKHTPVSRTSHYREWNKCAVLWRLPTVALPLQVGRGWPILTWWTMPDFREWGTHTVINAIHTKQ